MGITLSKEPTMDAWIIDQIKKQERQIEERPQLPLPLPPEPKPRETEQKLDRGVVVIEL
jgi:hypothetical protein